MSKYMALNQNVSPKTNKATNLIPSQSQKRLTPYAWVTRVAQLMAKEKGVNRF